MFLCYTMHIVRSTESDPSARHNAHNAEPSTARRFVMSLGCGALLWASYSFISTANEAPTAPTASAVSLSNQAIRNPNSAVHEPSPAVENNSIQTPMVYQNGTRTFTRIRMGNDTAVTTVVNDSCFGPDLVEVTMGAPDATNAIARYPNSPACDDGELTPSDFPQGQPG
jgi:hypothetical protein